MQSLSLFRLCNKSQVLHQNNVTVTSPGSGSGSSATAVELLLTVHTLTCKLQVFLAFHNLSLSALLPLTTYTHRSIHRHKGAVGDRPHDLRVWFLSVMFNFGWQCFRSPVTSGYAPPVGLCSCLSDYTDLSHLSCSLFPGRLSRVLCEHPSCVSSSGVLFCLMYLTIFSCTSPELSTVWIYIGFWRGIFFVHWIKKLVFVDLVLQPDSFLLACGSIWSVPTIYWTHTHTQTI